MNYVSVVVAIVFIMCAATWFTDGRKNYHGPSELRERLALARSV